MLSPIPHYNPSVELKSAAGARIMQLLQPLLLTTYLNVAFREKDAARALGARWDAGAKQWFVPNGMDTDVFARWLPDTVNTTSSAPLEAPQADTACSLSQLLNRVVQAVNSVTPRAEWVKAEISEFRLTKNGHGHLDLVELDAQKNLIGKASGKLFKTQADSLLAKFHTITGSTLAPGMKVLLLVRAQFHSQYGFSLIIEDIDPTYTLGDIAAKLAAIRETLQAEGLFDKNKRLLAPRDFQRCAVLSPAGAAGLGDFKREADLLMRHGLCHFDYFQASFQGELASGELCSALAAIFTAHAHRPFDALVIIRGGGATIDLAWLNDLAVARLVCAAPLPVMVGIGHERDQTILDEIAQQRFDTPSKVAHHLLTTITRQANEARLAAESIFMVAQHWVQQQRQSLEHGYQTLCNRLQQSLNLATQTVTHHYRQLLQALEHQLVQCHSDITQWQQHIALSAERQHHLALSQLEQTLAVCYQQAPNIISDTTLSLQALMQQIHTLPQASLHALAEQIDQYHASLKPLSAQQCQHYQEAIQVLWRQCVSLGPDATLARGFSLAKDTQGHAITSCAKATTEKSFQLYFHDGMMPVSSFEGKL